MGNKLKIIEWNINQRSGYDSNHTQVLMSEQFISDVIKQQNADIVVLTEFYKGGNWTDFISYTFLGYKVFYTMNPKNQNDVLIAVKNKYQVTHVEYLYSDYCNNNPNCLCVDIKINKEELSILGTRICIENGDEEDYKCRKKQFETMLQFIDKTKKNVVIGDFNNSRIIGDESKNYENVKKNYDKKVTKFYNYHMIKKEFENINLTMHTPANNCSWNGYIKNDHIITNGNIVVECDYDWNFTKDNEIYNGLNIEDSSSWSIWNSKCTSIGFPDHAILKVDIEL